MQCLRFCILEYCALIDTYHPVHRPICIYRYLLYAYFVERKLFIRLYMHQSNVINTLLYVFECINFNVAGWLWIHKDLRNIVKLCNSIQRIFKLRVNIQNFVAMQINWKMFFVLVHPCGGKSLVSSSEMIRYLSNTMNKWNVL